MLLIIKMQTLFRCTIIASTAHARSVFLLSFSINLLLFYQEFHYLISYATHYLFCDSEQHSCVRYRLLLGVFEVSVKRIQIKFRTTDRFILKQLDYSLSISMHDTKVQLTRAAPLSTITQQKSRAHNSDFKPISTHIS